MSFVHADLTEDPPRDIGRFDVVLSTSALHWVPCHPEVFRRFARVMREGARLEIDCGGEGNIARVEAALRAEGITWSPWNFRGPAETQVALEGAGFVSVTTWLSRDPVQLAQSEVAEYLRTVILGTHLARLSESDGAALVDAVAARIVDGIIDYVRLNLSATRGPGTG